MGVIAVGCFSMEEPNRSARWKRDEERIKEPYMKLVFMGTPDFAVGALEAIVKEGHEVAAGVTQPDKPEGGGKEMEKPPG